MYDLLMGLAALAILGFLIALVCVVHPIARLRMGTRKRALIGVAASFAIFLLFISVASETESQSHKDVRLAQKASDKAAADKKADENAKKTTDSAAAAATKAATTAPASKLTTSQSAAVRSAKTYLMISGFSQQGLIDQLSSPYGGKFPVEDATVAVDSLNVDWNAQAVKSAKTYLMISGFSCQGLIDQLSSPYGSKYTAEQARYAATQVGLC